MISHITPAFRTMFVQLPTQVQQQVREASPFKVTRYSTL
jgi:hypothetical protein